VASEADVIIEAARWYAENHRSLTRSALSVFELRQRLSRCSGQLRHAVRRSPPKDINVHPVVGMPQPVPHAADSGPGLARHELVRLLAKPDSGFAHGLECTWSVRG
jgi:hypothetical protein